MQICKEVTKRMNCFRFCCWSHLQIKQNKMEYFFNRIRHYRRRRSDLPDRDDPDDRHEICRNRDRDQRPSLSCRRRSRSKNKSNNCNA